ncbi:hypothetical protein BA896_020265 [Janthinobacterium lividum]|uniref:Uncharacterized protein n=1 Tax=Janthinobacterium lividum TaxID=29581 RepID=A0A1E8PK65_9BURK|nr:hypothetical protein BA896_020265 [Janthinobacterium lividum]
MLSPAVAGVAVLLTTPVKPRLGAGGGVAWPRSPSRAATPGAANAVAGTLCCSSDSKGCAGALALDVVAGLAATNGSRMSLPAACAVAWAVSVMAAACTLMFSAGLACAAFACT